MPPVHPELLIPSEKLTPVIPPDSLPASTADVAPLAGIAGQSRAIESVTFGLALEAPGYHIAVSGLPQSGRTSTARELLGRAASARPCPPDWVYLFNFADPSAPTALRLEPGRGRELERGLHQLIDACKTQLPSAFETDAYQERINRAAQPLTQARDEHFARLGSEAEAAGFLINPTPVGPVPVPKAVDGSPMSEETFAGLPPEVQADIRRRGEIIEQKIASLVREARQVDHEVHEAVRTVDEDVARTVVGPALARLRAAFSAEPVLQGFFTAIESDITGRVDLHKQFAPTIRDQVPPQLLAVAAAERDQVFAQYASNVFVSRPDGSARAPVEEERQLTFANLFGRIDFEGRGSAMVTDHLHIRPGALHRANGGYLLLQAQELLADARCWVKLKRCLKTGEIRIGDASDWMFPLPSVTLNPEGIALDVKVVLVGEPHLFRLLDAVDSEFALLFKVRADFEPDFEWSAGTVADYCGFVRQQVDICGLLPFSAEALAAVLGQGCRLVERQDRLSAQFGVIGDLCLEANHVARQAGADEVKRAHVAGAIQAARRRSGLIAERLQRMIADGTLHIETSGRVIGQVNGLAVFSTGAQSFGAPVRITCRTGPGQRGVVAIERETERSGAIHTKGILVLSGFLMGVFGRSAPLAFNASLTFEQSYDEVEGDSASSAELYAILASLAEAPLRQDIAVTGSVDQFGNIQPVGGVTEKVEAFYDLCSTVGLSGEQGVIIPAINRVNLTLRSDVVEAIGAGRFHLWGIGRIEQGLSILTGFEPGELQADGTWPDGSVFGRVAATLSSMRAAAVPVRHE